MTKIAFRLTRNTDPEERLEEAALWKALYDVYGENIIGFSDDTDEPDLPTFGRTSPFFNKNPISSELKYWNDPAFIKYAKRDVWVCDLNTARDKVNDLHRRGVQAFIKSTRSKHYICKVPIGTSLDDAMGYMAYSFIDDGPELIVQEHIKMTYEHRFFVIDREIVTDSPVQTPLTPLDYPLPTGSVSHTPNAEMLEINPQIYNELRLIAEKVASEMDYPHAAVDCAITETSDGRPTACLIEMNPMQLGQLGLFACDVRALAKASHKLIKEYEPTNEKSFKI